VLQWLDRNGVDSKTVNFVQMPLGTAVTALQASHIDAIDLVEPLFTRWKAELTDLGTPLSAVADGRPVEIFGTVATKNFIEANSVVVRAAADALRMAARWANDPRNSREAAVTIADFTKVDSASVSAYPRLHFGERLDPALIQPSIDMMAKYAFLPRAFPAGDLFANLPG
jgi:ABC-type nitrate/sulfonate/bicarbonate transport system substrate-binding protein